MLARMPTRRGLALPFVVMVCAAPLGCSSLPVSARAATDEIAVAEVVRADASTAGAQCNAQAEYAYYEVRLGLGPDGPMAKDELFPTWYEHALADSSLPWASYCADLAKTGVVYHGGVLALRGYARAVLALAAGKDFDGSGFTRAANGLATITTTLGAPSALGDVAKSIGGTVTALATIVEKHVRAQVLRLLVGDAAPEVAKLVGGLGGYLDALEVQRTTVEHHRSVVLRAADRARDGNGKLGGAADGAIAVDLGLGGGARLERTKLRLARDHALLNALAAGHAELAKMPWTERAPPELVAKLDVLEAALGAIADAPPEE